MKAIIPAAGDGTRIEEETDGQPKGMLDVGGQPLMSHAMDAAIDLGCTELILIVKSINGPIRDEFDDSYRGVPVQYVAQPIARGLGDAVHRGTRYIDDPFLVILGDTVFDGDLSAVTAAVEPPGVDGAVMVEHVPAEEIRKYAAVYTNQDGFAEYIVEKPESATTTRAEIGVYVFPPEFGSVALPPNSEDLELQTIENRLIDRRKTIVPVDFDGTRVNVNTPEDLRLARDR